MVEGRVVAVMVVAGTAAEARVVEATEEGVREVGVTVAAATAAEAKEAVRAVGARVAVAKAVQLNSGESVTRISAVLVGLVTCLVCDGSDDSSSDGLGNVSDGSGYVLLPARRQRQRGLQLSAPPPRATSARAGRALVQAEGSCCGSSVGVDAFYGDINGDCVFDINDVRRASLLLLSQPPTPAGCSHQRG